MIATIKGKITEAGTRYIVIETSGLGYRVNITDDALQSLKIGNDAYLWTHFAVREDSQDLYGFTTKKERDFFELLISISGIGPKSALNILSLVAVDTLSSSIRTGSVAHLVKVSGIGRKTAEKIVLELKDKMGGISDGAVSAEMTSDMDALEALRSLGYDTNDAREALKKIGADISDTGAKVKAALKELGK